MSSKIADAEKTNFSNRLKTSLEAAGIPLKISQFVRAYNARADGAAVTVHAARKWLHGESVPSHEKVVVLATWLGVNAAWLRFGDAKDESLIEGVISEASISTPILVLMNDIMSLPPQVQKSIREIVDVFLRNFDHENKER